jgi:germination protein M
VKAAVLIALACALGATLVAGCGGGDRGAVEETAPARTVRVYFPASDGAGLVVERRRVPAGEPALGAALAELAAGPRAAGAARALPAATTVRSASAAGGTARVDLNRAFVDHYPGGGSAAEVAVLAPLVWTATAQPGVRRVLVTVDGRAPDLLGSQFDLSAPLTRADFPEGGGP